jgi:phospholipase/carboxylesterase
MWIFASRLPEEYLLLAPRGLFTTPIGGYSWHRIAENKKWPSVDDFRPAVNELHLLMENWPASAPAADFVRFRMAGFSQGGALAYTFAMLNPKPIIALAGLATFLPEDSENYLHPTLFKDILIYISHGVKDNLVPVTRARYAVEQLDRAGAQVQYCESNVGHKLSAECFKGMEVFFTREI